MDLFSKMEFYSIFRIICAMNGVMERTLGILELLVKHGEGLELAAIALALDIPPSAVHRLLSDLQRLGYVRQTQGRGAYALSIKLIALGLSHLSSAGIVDVAQPLLDRLAEQSGELVRLSVIDGKRLTWVAKAQGSRQGLRYDPEMGSEARLSCTASGQAWLMSLSDEAALAAVAEQGLGAVADYGPAAPQTIVAVLEALAAARERGYSLTCETFTAGLNAMGAPVRIKGQSALGVITIAGPTVRLRPEKMHALRFALLSTADQLAAASRASPFLNQGAK
jgi:IclR family transcriptional regulator, acetate operon repressor